MINRPPPLQSLNIRIPMIVLTKGRRFINQGSTLNPKPWHPAVRSCSQEGILFSAILEPYRPWSKLLKKDYLGNYDKTLLRGILVVGVYTMALMLNARLSHRHCKRTPQTPKPHTKPYSPHQVDRIFGCLIIKSPYTPNSIYLRGTVG